MLPRWSRFAPVTLALLALVAACSSGDDTSTTTTGETTTTEVEEVAADERVVVVGEEYLLADLLALGVSPVASTATVDAEGFQGLDEYDTSEIEALPATEPNLERLASFDPDRIIILEFFADQVGRDVLEGIAEVTVVPDGMDPAELVTMYGEMFGREDRAAELVQEYEDAMAMAAEELDGLEVSVAAIYGGPSVAAFVQGPWAVPATLVESGVTLVPGPDEVDADDNGRAYLSLERLDLLDAPQMLLLQSPLVEGEDEAIAEVMENPLWGSLPAVQDDAVTEMDRLGYPGIEGRIRLVDDLVDALTS
jgi:iron complex transport system substrate-binding protein